MTERHQPPDEPDPTEDSHGGHPIEPAEGARDPGEFAGEDLPPHPDDPAEGAREDPPPPASPG